MRKWLYEIRRKKGMTQSQIADIAKIAQPSYHYIEVGAKNPSVKTAKKIAKALGFSWTRFFDDIG